MKSLILLLILASFSSAHAQMSCMDLFNHSRPTDEQINAAIFDLKYLLTEQYSKDKTVSAFARSETQKKFLELNIYLTLSEIKDRLRRVTLNSNKNNISLDQLKESGNKLLQNLDESTIITDFLSAHGYIRDKQNLSSDSILILASKHNRLDIVKILLQYTANINTKNNNGDSALTLAASNYDINTKIVKTLLEHGADINLKNNEGRTPLMEATVHGHLDTVQLLLQYKPNINAKDNNGMTALRLTRKARKIGQHYKRASLRAAGARE